jgi:hypothetical protein
MNEQWQTLINSLSQEKTYLHPVSCPIEVKRTHSAIVFLTGEYAYKLKKPVNLGFLDFSTLDKRKHFLEEELRLNQRLAPDLYLEVLPISQVSDQFILGDNSNIVEYSLKMRQFPQDTLLSHLEENHQLTSDIIQALGKVVADFHLHTPSNDYITSFGKIDKIREAIDENYQQTDQYIDWLQTQDQFTETQAFTTDYLENKTDYFLQRQQKGKIRECHGDLHLNNICYWQNKIYLFDRIEFNEPFRFVDTMYDVAFTVMDLDVRNQKELGNLFLNTYLEQTGDWQGLQVLPFYLCRQAYVRAKVNSLLLEDASLSEKERETTINSAQKYYHLAWQYTQKEQGRLILMSGLSGSGKTTIARKIAPEVKGIHLRSDAVRKHLAGIKLEETGSDKLYTYEMSVKTYQELLSLGEMLLKQGVTVILDAKFDRREWRMKAQEMAKSLSVPFKIIYCEASPEILQQRLRERQGDISDATPQLLEQQIQQFESFEPTEEKYLIRYDTEKTCS